MPIRDKRYKRDALEDILDTIKARRQNLSKIKPKKKLAKWLPPISIEREYQRILRGYVDKMSEEINKIIVPNLQSLVDSRNAVIPAPSRADGYSDEAQRMIQALKVSFTAINFNPSFVSANIGQKTSAWNDNQWRKVMKSALGVDLYQSEPWMNDTMKSFVSETVTLISKMETDLLDSIEGTVQRGLRSGNGPLNIARQIEKTVGISKNRANLIGRDQVSKLNGQLSQLRQTGIGIDQYTWSTSGDERVRPTHRANNGKKFSWDEPPENTGHPGNDYQCRCVAEPDFTPVFNELRG